MHKMIKIAVLILLAAACSKEPEPKPTTPLIVKTSSGDIRFNVEVAATPEELQTGLMNRSSLAFNSGMIFNIYPVRPTAMWMKNTKISLDMLFVAPDGSISLIVENTKPMSEEMIISRDPVRAVVELNGGQVKRHGIKVGDKINHGLLNNMLDVKTPGPEVKNPVAKPAPKADVAIPELKGEVPEVPEVPQPSKAEPASQKPEQPQAPAKLPAPAPGK